jgi:hypothetical protein
MDKTRFASDRDDVGPVTAESIQRAKKAVEEERERLRQHAGIVVTADGRIVILPRRDAA